MFVLKVMYFSIQTSKHAPLILGFCGIVCGTDFINGLNDAPVLQAFKGVTCIALFRSKLYFTTEWKHKILCIIRSMKTVSGF